MRLQSLTFFLIGLLVLNLASCAGKPRRYLAADASLIRPGMSSAEVERMFGRPHALRPAPSGREEWYYYEVRRPFWQRIPLVGKHLGRPDVEALQVVMGAGRVVKAVYYVPRR